jgi:hypothetical protein
MEINSINVFFKEVYFPVINIEKQEKPQNESGIVTVFDDHVLIFNNYISIEAYKEFMWQISEEFKSEIIKLFIDSKSRISVLFLLKQISLEIFEIKNSFKKIHQTNLNKYEQVFKQVLNDSNSKLPDNIINERIYRLNYNIHISFSDNFQKSKIERDEFTVISFIHNFVSAQMSAFKEFENTINLFADFIKNINSDEFDKKNVFRELDLIKNYIPENKKVRVFSSRNPDAISKLDIRQSALLYHYMEEAELYIKYKYDKDKSFLVHYLTGYSDQRIRTTEGFGELNSIKGARRIKQENNDDKKNKEIEFYNLISVKEALNDVIELIDKDIEAFSATLKKV